MASATSLKTGSPLGTHSLARYRSEFPIFRDKVYLNPCSLGALGERTRRRLGEFLDLWQARGAAAWYDVWWAALAELRRRYGRLVGATPAEIALAPSISVALSSLAEALDYRRRPKVVVTSLDFPTVAYQWLAKRPRGVEVVVVESPDQVSVPVEAIARALDERTALVATSHVYFTSGAIQDIKAVADAARQCGALTVIDAYQAVGQVPVDVKAAGVDVLMAGGLKWLLGGPGIVFLYVREELAPRLAPAIAGWFGHRNQFAFDPRALEGELRSEEHTSELQSLTNLVCRLLLEKKKKKTQHSNSESRAAAGRRPRARIPAPCTACRIRGSPGSCRR